MSTFSCGYGFRSPQPDVVGTNNGLIDPLHGIRFGFFVIEHERRETFPEAAPYRYAILDHSISTATSLPF